MLSRSPWMQLGNPSVSFTHSMSCLSALWLNAGQDAGSVTLPVSGLVNAWLVGSVARPLSAQSTSVPVSNSSSQLVAGVER